MQQLFESLAHDIMKRYRSELMTTHTHTYRMRILEEMRKELLSLKTTYSDILQVTVTEQQFAQSMNLPVFKA